MHKHKLLASPSLFLSLMVQVFFVAKIEGEGSLSLLRKTDGWMDGKEGRYGEGEKKEDEFRDGIWLLALYLYHY